jgi:hypothetical protein
VSIALLPYSTAYGQTQPAIAPEIIAALQDEALAAPVADPLWLLARQSQTGAFAASNGGSAVATKVAWANGPLSRNGSALAGPLEGEVEPEQRPPLIQLDSSRRIRLACELRRRLREAAIPAAELNTVWANWRTDFGAIPTAQTSDSIIVAAGRLPNPVPLLETLFLALGSAGTGTIVTVPGLAGHSQTTQDSVKIALRGWYAWAERFFSGADSVGSEPVSWDGTRLVYAIECVAERSEGPVNLTSADYDGTGFDWYSVDKSSLGPTPTIAPASLISGSTHVIPARAAYAGMPRPRWWEFEDGDVNLDALRASGDPAQSVLAAFAHNYSNDWFLCPIGFQPGWAEITQLEVADTFGTVTAVPSAAKADGDSRVWRMWEVTVADGTTDDTPNLRLCWPVGPPPLDGPIVEEVLLARDEMANLAWLVELQTQSQDGTVVDRFQRWQQQRPDDQNPQDRASGIAHYRLGTTVPDFWYPLVATGDPGTQMLRYAALPPEAIGISDQGVQGRLVPHQPTTGLAPPVITRQGRRFVRRDRLMLGPQGIQTWRVRVATLGQGEASSGLRFDILDGGT